MRYRKKNPLLSRLTQALAPAMVASLLLYFGHHLVAGRNGVLALRAYEAALPELEAQAAELSAQRSKLEGRIARLHPDHVDPDLLDEMVRLRLGFVHPDDKVVDLQGF